MGPSISSRSFNILDCQKRVYIEKQYSFFAAVLYVAYDIYYVFMTLVPQCILHTKITFNPSQAKNNFVELSCWQHATTTRCLLVYTLLLSEIASLSHAERVRFLPDTHRLCSARVHLDPLAVKISILGLYIHHVNQTLQEKLQISMRLLTLGHFFLVLRLENELYNF